VCSEEVGRRYRLEVTVDDVLGVQHLQAAQQRVGEAADQSHAEALEVVLLDQLVQVHPVTHAGGGGRGCYPWRR